jgi:hypothetical protein
MPGASSVVVVTFAAGDVRRFDNPRQLIDFRGLVLRERSTGQTIRRAGLTRTGSRRTRRVLVELSPLGQTLLAWLEGFPKAVRDIAWQAQIRLCDRWRRLSSGVEREFPSLKRSAQPWRAHESRAPCVRWRAPVSVHVYSGKVGDAERAVPVNT